MKMICPACKSEMSEAVNDRFGVVWECSCGVIVRIPSGIKNFHDDFRQFIRELKWKNKQMQ